MIEKKRTTLYLEENVLNLARIDNINISETVNNLLKTYLSTQSLEEIHKEREKLQSKIGALDKREADLRRSNIAETRQEGMSNNIIEELQDIFSKRLEQFNDQYANEMWITSPRNLQKCKILGKEPLEVLAELNAWYLENNGGKTSK